MTRQSVGRSVRRQLLTGGHARTHGQQRLGRPPARGRWLRDTFKETLNLPKMRLSVRSEQSGKQDVTAGLGSAAAWRDADT